MDWWVWHEVKVVTHMWGLQVLKVGLAYPQMSKLSTVSKSRQGPICLWYCFPCCWNFLNYANSWTGKDSWAIVQNVSWHLTNGKWKESLEQLWSCLLAGTSATQLSKRIKGGSACCCSRCGDHFASYVTWKAPLPPALKTPAVCRIEVGLRQEKQNR